VRELPPGKMLADKTAVAEQLAMSTELAQQPITPAEPARCPVTSARPSAGPSMPGCSAPPPPHTRRAYRLDLDQFLAASGIEPDALEHLAAIRPEHVSQWRERLAADKQANSTIRRKLTALRSLFSYLQTYGYSGANPAHGKFVKAPALSRDGTTVALSPHDCRRLLNAPEEKPELQTPADIRDRAMLAVLAYSGCRVGELVRLRVRDYKTSGEHLIRADQKRKAEERIDTLLLEGLDSGPPIPVTPEYWEEKKRRLTERLGKAIRPQ
jgi:integrase